MLVLIIFIFLFLIIVFFFASKKLSPIPYFPSNKKDLPLIITALNLKNNQVVIDLGAGDGVVIFESAKIALRKKLNTKFLAVEINPFLILIMMAKRLFHPNKKNIKIIYDDMFKINLQKIFLSLKDFHNWQKNLTIYLYISPWFIEKIVKNLINQKKKYSIKNISFISYFYPISFLKRKKEFKGINKIFVY